MNPLDSFHPVLIAIFTVVGLIVTFFFTIIGGIASIITIYNFFHSDGPKKIKELFIEKKSSFKTFLPLLNINRLLLFSCVNCLVIILAVLSSPGSNYRYTFDFYDLFYLGQLITITYLIIIFSKKPKSIKFDDSILTKIKEDVWPPSTNDDIIKNAVELGQKKIRDITFIWGFIIIAWLYQYTCMSLIEINISSIGPLWEDFMNRTLNLLNLIGFIFLVYYYKIETTPTNKKLSESIVFYILGLVFLFFLVDFLILSFSDNEYFISSILTVINGFLTSLIFLLFFSRLKSFFLQFPFWFNLILTVYALGQLFYSIHIATSLSLPFEIIGEIHDPDQTKKINLNEKFKLFNKLLMGSCCVVFIVGKIILGTIFSKKKYLTRLLFHLISRNLLEEKISSIYTDIEKSN